MSSHTRRHRFQPEHDSSRSRFVNQAHLERLVLFLSYLHFLATLVGALLCAELLFSDSPLSLGSGFLSRALLPLGLLAVFNIPFHFRIRNFGIRKLHFLEHEAHLDATHSFPQTSRANRTSPDTYRRIHTLIQAIDAADVWDRPALRQTAKAWLLANRFELDDDARAYLRDRVGYLMPDELAASHTN